MSNKQDYYENVIEWLDGDDTISVTVHQKKYVNRIRRLAENTENKVSILHENDDGSIFAHLPLSCLKFNPKRAVIMDEEKKSEMIARLKSANKRLSADMREV